HKGACSTGRRVNLSTQFSDMLTPALIENGVLERSYWRFLMDSLFKQGNHSGQGVYFKNKFIRKYINKKNRGILGSNFSAHKDDLLAVNGFDERYKHPAVGEDTDIEYRLRLYGAKVLSLINVANQYHLFHKILPRKKENDLIFETVKKEKKYF